jgi:hypothetical protein
MKSIHGLALATILCVSIPVQSEITSAQPSIKELLANSTINTKRIDQLKKEYVSQAKLKNIHHKIVTCTAAMVLGVGGYQLLKWLGLDLNPFKAKEVKDAIPTQYASKEVVDALVKQVDINASWGSWIKHEVPKMVGMEAVKILFLNPILGFYGIKVGQAINPKSEIELFTLTRTQLFTHIELIKFAAQQIQTAQDQDERALFHQQSVAPFMHKIVHDMESLIAYIQFKIEHNKKQGLDNLADYLIKYTNNLVIRVDALITKPKMQSEDAQQLIFVMDDFTAELRNAIKKCCV